MIIICEMRCHGQLKLKKEQLYEINLDKRIQKYYFVFVMLKYLNDQEIRNSFNTILTLLQDCLSKSFL